MPLIRELPPLPAALPPAPPEAPPAPATEGPTPPIPGEPAEAPALPAALAGSRSDSPNLGTEHDTSTGCACVHFLRTLMRHLPSKRCHTASRSASARPWS
jgi:hypothetical protein